MGSAGSRTPDDQSTVAVDDPSRSSDASRKKRPVTGDRLGRYVVLGTLGEGGMGVVYRAHDTMLDRDVALKRVRVEGRSVADEARLLREAQAMARLSHPNVVPVYAAERIDDEIVIAMELVDGVTLREHLRCIARDWRGIVQLFVAAGRGLEAAHSAGLVHRDFKPTNVLVDTDGRVRVMDFGLARAGQPSVDTPDADDGFGSGSFSTSLTAAGSVMGTPRYMAPEQHTGQGVDARADQFAFCVALFCALFGAPPFVAKRYEDLVRAKRRGEVVPPPPAKARAVPRRLRRTILRGLAADPASRYPSMASLLGELEALAAPRRRAGWVIGGGVVTATLGTTVWLSLASGATCLEGPTPIDEIWNDEARGRLSERFDTLETNGAAYTRDRVAKRLDAAAKSWTSAYRDACRATHERGEQSATELDLRMVCLAGQADAIEATLTVLQEVDTETVEHAVRTVSGLPAVDTCSDVEELRAEVAGPEGDEARAKVAKIRAELERVAALHRSGRYKDAHAEAENLLARARATEYRPVVAEAMARLGNVKERLGDYDGAATLLTDAFHEARSAGHSRQIIRVAADMIYVDGYRRQDSDAAARWIREATAEIERHGGDEHALATVASHGGMIAMMDGDLDEAIERFTYVLEVEQRADPPRPLGLAGAHDKLGTIYYAAERVEPARDHIERAIAMYERELGPDHVKLLPPLTNLGATLMAVEQSEASLEPLRRAEAIAVRVYGEDNADVGMIRNHLGNSLSKLGRHEEAEQAFATSARTLEATLGTDHQYTASVLSNWGAALSRKGDNAGALEKYRAAYEIHRRLVPPDHPAIADFESNIAMSLSALGRHEEALEHHRAAVPLLAKHFGETSAAYALGLARVGSALVELERFGEAVVVLEQFIDIGLPDHVPAHDIGPPRFALAQALWETGGDRARALRLAAEAVELVVAAGMSRAPIDDWLATHRLQTG